MRARMKCRVPFFLMMASLSKALTVCERDFDAPSSSEGMAGRIAQKRPWTIRDCREARKGTSFMAPKARGLPGLMATCQKCIWFPTSFMMSLTRSLIAHGDTPEEMIRSARRADFNFFRKIFPRIFWQFRSAGESPRSPESVRQWRSC